MTLFADERRMVSCPRLSPDTSTQRINIQVESRLEEQGTLLKSRPRRLLFAPYQMCFLMGYNKRNANSGYSEIQSIFMNLRATVDHKTRFPAHMRAVKAQRFIITSAKTPISPPIHSSLSILVYFV
ncbi:hypothetical protein TNCV_4943331 [Trichonephila clavipes]|nr:hypothetical protein TNCV_4943331 [Trichonephila clavipes]